MGQFSALHIDVQSEDCVGAYVLLPRGANRLRPSGAAMVPPSTVASLRAHAISWRRRPGRPPCLGTGHPQRGT